MKANHSGFPFLGQKLALSRWKPLALSTKLLMSLVWIGNYCRANGDWLLLFSFPFFPVLCYVCVRVYGREPVWPHGAQFCLLLSIPLGGVVGVGPAVTCNRHLPCRSFSPSLNTLVREVEGGNETKKSIREL